MSVGMRSRVFVGSSGDGRWRLVRPLTFALAVSLVVSASSVVSAGAAVAAPQPVAAPAPEIALERPDEAAARATARLTGKPVKITGLTTDSSEFMARPDGTVEATVHAGPVRVRRDRGWAAVDLTLRRSPDGSVAAVAPVHDVWMSGARASGEGDLVTVGSGADRVGLGWSGALPEPVLSANRATYPEVAPGVDVVVEATRFGVEEFVVLKSADALAHVPSLATPLTGPSIASHVRSADGSITLQNKAGRTVATVPAPQMWDARVGPDGQSPLQKVPVGSTTVKRAAKTARVAGKEMVQLARVQMTLAPDLAWLNDPARVFPITIDPRIDVETASDTTVTEGETTDQGGEKVLQLGLRTVGTALRKTRSFVSWNTSELRGKQILGGTVSFYNYYSTTCSPNSWEIWSTDPTSADTRWANQPAWLAREATSTQTKGFNSSCGDGWVSVDARSFFQRAAAGNAQRGTMGLRATDESDLNGYKNFRSRNADDNAELPKATVSYNSYPAATGRSTVPATACATGADRPYVNTKTPILRSTVTDADGGDVKAKFDVWPTGGSAAILYLETSAAGAGSVVSAAVPAGLLAEGKSYSWRVSADDGITYSADGRTNHAYSSWCEFTVDSSAPDVPHVSSSMYPSAAADSSWGHGGQGRAGQFTITPAGTSLPVAVAQATSTNTPCAPGETADRAIDGSTATKWCTMDPSRVLTLRLQGEQLVTGVVIRNAGANNEPTMWNTKDYDIALSNDDVTYRTALQVRGNRASVSTQDLTSPGRASYVKITVLTPTQDGSPHTRIVDVNLLSGTKLKPSSADGSPGCHSAGEGAAQAFDGDVDTHWCTFAPSKWLQADLGEVRDVTNVVVRHAQASGEPASYNTRDFEIQTSADGSQWEVPIRVQGNTAAVTNHRLPAGGRARYVKLVVTTPTQHVDSAARIPELEIYQTGKADDVVSFVYQLDTDTAPTTVGAANPTIVSITPTSDGRRTLTVRSRDSAGNLSQPHVYQFNVGGAGLSEPRPGATVVVRTKLRISGDPGLTRARFEYRRGPGGVEYDIPLPHLRTAAGGPVAAYPVRLADLGSNAIWNAADTLGAIGGVVQVRAVMFPDADGVPGFQTEWITVSVDANGDGAASEDVGPGSVNLLTGDYAVSSQDADEFGLQVSRAASSREPADGWIPQGERLNANQQQASTDLAGFADGGVAVLSRSTVRGQGSSTDSLMVSPSTSGSTDTFASLETDNGPFKLGMKAGHRYRATGWIFVPAATGLSPGFDDRGLRIMAFYKDAGGSYHRFGSTRAAWTDAWQELSVDLPIPAGATEAFIRVYNGLATGPVFYDNLSVTEIVAPFGPQWRGGASDGVGGSDYTTLTFPTPELAQVTGIDGSWLTFARNSQGAFFPEPGSEDLSLSRVNDNTYRMTDLDGTVTEFGNQGGTLVVTSTWTADNASTSRYLYDTTDKRTLIKRVVNPVEPGVGDCATPAPARGCEVLEYEYGTAKTATGSTLGDIVDQVRGVKVWSWDPDKNVETAVEVARYAYDEAGRLREVWDPRLAQPIKTRYAYDDAGRVTTVAAAGQLPWSIDYGAAGGGDDNAGRVARIRRSALKPGSRDQTDGEVATNIVYHVPLTRAAGGPHDLDGAAIATWGQKDLPTDATAVFGPDTDPGTNTATGAKPGTNGYTYATTHYLNASGLEVNTATPGGHIDSRTFDEFGNNVWTLEAANRELALGTLPDAATKSAELNLPTDTAARADLLASTTTYSRDGLDVIESLGPVVNIALETDLSVEGKPTISAGTSVVSRAHTTYRYDEGKPDGGTYHLETTEIDAAAVAGYPDADPRISRTGYGAEKGGTSGWKLKKPTSVTTDAGTAYVVYDAAGRTLQSWGIGSNGDDAKATFASYYTAGSNTDEPACGNKPEWAGQPCVTRAGGPITGQRGDMTDRLPIKRVEGYTRTGDTATVSETAAGKTRRTETSYDAADRVTSVKITSDEGVALPAVTTDYDPTTGNVTATHAGDATITREYDRLGRVLTYTDADGGITRSEFDRYGKATKVSDNTGTTSYTYDRQAEPRGLLTSVTDSIAGTFTAKYSPDGHLVTMKYPGGMTRTDTLNASFAPVGRAYTRDSDGQVLYAESVVENTAGQWINHSYTGGSRTYGYDTLGRLTGVQQVTANACTTRAYAYDNRTNRTSKRTFQPGAGGQCKDSGDPDAEDDHRYDSADRITDTGYLYDAFGRTTGLPGGLSNQFYANDLVAAQQQDDTRQQWTLDPAHRFRGYTTAKQVNGAWANATSKLNHYGDDSDEARWIIEDTTLGSLTRNVSGPDADLAATTSATGDVRLHLVNLHGDIAATIDPGLTSPEFAGYDEFGIPDGGQDQQRYGWLGGKQRSGDALGGAILMGVRLYSPALGRFLQVDPVAGGSATAYDYCSGDPVNCIDLDGNWSWRKVVGRVARVASYASMIPGPIGTIAGVVSAVGYAATGNWKEAAWAAGGALAATVGAGAAVRGAKLAANTVRASSKAGRSGGWASKAGRSCNSFSPDTPVLMADGSYLPISELRYGDVVTAVDPETGERSRQPVLDVIVGQGTKHLIDIDLDGDTTTALTATDQHPIWVVGKGWTDAIRIQPGDWLLDSGNRQHRVRTVTDRGLELGQTVYNLNVGNVHTFVVSTDGTTVVVHNASACPVGSGRSGKGARLRELAKDSKVAKHLRGFITNSIRQSGRPKVPPGYQVAHYRTHEAARGCSYRCGHLQTRDLHKLQHKHDRNGKRLRGKPKIRR